MAANPLRLVFAGTPEFAAGHLSALLDSEHEVIAVYTQPDRPSGRGKKLTPSPVKRLAEEAGIQVLQPPSLRNPEAVTELQALQADALIVVAYGLILPRAILDAPRLGCLNVHASLLPRWRGAAPIQRAIEAGDRETGVCIMQMDAGLDTGPVLARASLAIGAFCNAGQLHDQLLERGPPLLLQVLEDLPASQQQALEQEEAGVTYAHKIEKSEAQLDFSQDAELLQRKVLAFNPFPVAWCMLGEQRLKIQAAFAEPGKGSVGEILSAGERGIRVACGNGVLNIRRLQLPGGKPLDAAEMLNARQELFAPGTVLGG